MRTQVGVERITVEVSVRDRRSPAGQGLEGVAARQEEGHRTHRVGRVGLEGLAVDRHRRDALPVGLGRVVGVAHVRGQAELEHGPGVLRVQIRLPLLLERVLDVRSLQRHIPQLVGEGLDLVGLRIRDRPVLAGHQVGAQPARVDHADVDALPVRGEDGLAQGIGHQVAQGRLDATVRPRLGRAVRSGKHAAHEGGPIPGRDDALARFLRVGLGLIDNRLRGGVRAALSDLGGRDENRVGAGYLPRRRVNRQADQAQVVRVGARRDARQARVRGLEGLHRVDVVKLVGHVRVPTHEAVDILADLDVVVLHVIVEHGDDDVGLSAGLQLGGQGVNASDRIREGQARSGSGTELVGYVLRDRADERHLHARGRYPQLVVPQVGGAIPVGAHALDVGPQVREGRLHELTRVGPIDALLEDRLPHVQLVVTDRRRQGVHRVQGRDGRIILESPRDVGGGTDVVAQQREGGVRVGLPSLLQVAVHRGQPGFAHASLLGDLLNVPVHVRQGVEIQGDRRGLLP